MKTTAAINVAWKARGLDEDTARDVYERVTGKRRLTLMTSTEQQAVLAEFNGTPVAARAKGLTGPYAKKLQALWIAGWNLGIVHDRRDSAMLSFIKRQTGIEHTAFLRAAADARKAVEALKGWLTRAGGVDWSAFSDPQDCVIAAQSKALGRSRDSIGYNASGITSAAGAKAADTIAKVALMQLLGEQIRAKAAEVPIAALGQAGAK